MDAWWAAYAGIGIAVGLMAGMLGIGGGMIMVPMLVFVFTAKGFPPEHLMHLAIATSMSTVLFTSLSSVRAHHRRGGVDWPVVRAMAPGILAGSFAASLIAGLIPTRPLAMFFTGFIFYAATQMFFETKPRRTRAMPGPGGLFAAGATIGALSSLVAAGGAFLSIPFLAWCNLPLRRAIGTAAAIGFPIALAGSAGYALNGLRISGLPPNSFGYIHVPALMLVAAPSMLAAPWGARLAHSMPVANLRVVFALMLYALAARMLWTLW